MEGFRGLDFKVVRQNISSLIPGRKFISGFRNRPPPKRFIVLGEGPAPNQLRNSGRVGAMDYLSDNLEIKTPETLYGDLIFKVIAVQNS